jgi:hypothetical protein
MKRGFAALKKAKELANNLVTFKSVGLEKNLGKKYQNTSASK